MLNTPMCLLHDYLNTFLGVDLLLTVPFNWLFVDRNGSSSDVISRHPVILILGKVSKIVTLLFSGKEKRSTFTIYFHLHAGYSTPSLGEYTHVV